MAGKFGKDNFKGIAEKLDETAVNQATRETMKVVEKNLNKENREIDPHEEDRVRK